MNEWQQVLEQVRASNRNLSENQFLDRRPVWRAQAYREHAGEPEPVVRAQAFRRVLMGDTLHLYEGDVLCGSHAGWFSQDKFAGLAEADYQALVAEHQARGHRNFWSGWDHSLADYPTLLTIGVAGYLARARESLKTHPSPCEQDALRGMILSLEAFSAWMIRWSGAAAARGERDMAEAAGWVANEPPRTFREAVQLVAFTHLAFESEGRYAMALGRIDQYLLPFYRRDIEGAILTRAGALDLVCHLWVKLAENGNVQNICIGGQTPEGNDGTNELSLICLEATRQVQSPYTNLSARFHDGTPDSFYKACFEVIRTGIGFPAIFNDHVLIPGLVEIGVPLEVARDHCMVGCIETMLPGRQQAWSDSRYNMPLMMMNALHKMRGQAARSYESVLQAFLDEMRESLGAHTRQFNDYISQFPVERFPDPFLSALTRDCIGRAKDINDGGAEFKRMHGIAIMGLGTVADSLAALKTLVFEGQRFSYEAVMEALDADFKGHEPMRQALVNDAPKYGNDDDAVDSIAAFLVDWTSRECLKHEIAGGGRFVSAMAANTSNIPAGKEVGATPDGRYAFTPLSDAASPYFGRDTHGPTAFLNSVAKPDYRLVLTGSVINMKFEPAFFQGPGGARVFVSLMKAFVRNRVPELQFNFTGNEVLKAAQASPELHRDLVVRVSGFSQYFVHLPRDVQDDVIRRRAHARL
jgi:formate C-acetyltransferase